MFLHQQALAGFILALLSNFAVAPPTTENEEQSSPDVRLDAMAERIESLDRRLRQIEELLFQRLGQADSNGIIRDESGRPVGVWGIDHDERMIPPRYFITPKERYQLTPWSSHLAPQR